MRSQKTRDCFMDEGVVSNGVDAVTQPSSDLVPNTLYGTNYGEQCVVSGSCRLSLSLSRLSNPQIACTVWNSRMYLVLFAKLLSTRKRNSL